jgi:hypothetical protein
MDRTPSLPNTLLDTGHEYEVMEKTMKILHIEKKGQMLDTYERLHI